MITAISPRTAARRIGKYGVAELMEDVQSFWNDVYTEAIEAGEDVEKTIVRRGNYSGKWKTDPMFIADEVYYYAVQYDNGNIDVMDELECELAHIDFD